MTDDDKGWHDCAKLKCGIMHRYPATVFRAVAERIGADAFKFTDAMTLTVGPDPLTMAQIEDAVRLLDGIPDDVGKP